MLKIPQRPDLVSTTLRAHAELADHPVFFYAPPPANSIGRLLDGLAGTREQIRAAIEQLEGEDLEEALASAPARPAEDGRAVGKGLLELLCDLFDAQIRRIDNLAVGEQPFDRSKHLADIPFAWKLEVGREIMGRLKDGLSGAERGN